VPLLVQGNSGFNNNKEKGGEFFGETQTTRVEENAEIGDRHLYLQFAIIVPSSSYNNISSRQGRREGGTLRRRRG